MRRRRLAGRGDRSHACKTLYISLSGAFGLRRDVELVQGPSRAGLQPLARGAARCPAGGGPAPRVWGSLRGSLPGSLHGLTRPFISFILEMKMVSVVVVVVSSVAHTVSFVLCPVDGAIESPLERVLT